MPITEFSSGPFTPDTISAGGDWASTANAKVEDGSTALAAGVGPGGSGQPSSMTASDFDFALPDIAIIDGIMVEAKVRTGGGSVQGSMYLTSTGGFTAISEDNPSAQAWPAGTLTWLTWGSSTDLWNRVWTVAEINTTDFAAVINETVASGSTNLEVDGFKVTVYWHYSADVAAAEVPKRYLHKVYNKGRYVGNLKKVVSPFGYAQDINSVGSSVTLECAISPDTAILESDRLVTEDGEPLTDEDGNYLYTDGQPSVIGYGSSLDPLLMQNGNRVVIFEYSYYHPNGKAMFSGQINRIEASFGGGASENIKLLVLSDGLDMANYIARGAPFAYTADVTQNTWNLAVSCSQSVSSWQRYGQSWIVGAGVTKLGAIQLALQGTADVTVTVYDGVNSPNVLGSVTQRVDTGGAAIGVQFGFPSLIEVSPGNTYFFTVSVADGQSINLNYSNSNPYANGEMYSSSYGGGGGGSYASVAGSDLYFIASSGVETTTATYTSKDPSTQMLVPIVEDYNLRGGAVTCTDDSVDATGLTLTYTFNTDTLLDAVKAIHSLSPNGFYYYVDLGTNVLNFKEASTTPDITLVKGRHLTTINLVMSIENLKNYFLFSGQSIAGTNLYTAYEDQASISQYGIRLERKSDNRVSLQPTADAIGDSFIAENKDERFETVVTVLDRTMDITLLKPGMTVGLRGFGSFIDTIVLQIVRVEYSPESVNLTLGTMPIRYSDEFQQITRGLIAEQTIANPTAPS